MKTATYMLLIAVGLAIGVATAGLLSCTSADQKVEAPTKPVHEAELVAEGKFFKTYVVVYDGQAYLVTYGTGGGVAMCKK